MEDECDLGVFRTRPIGPPGVSLTMDNRLGSTQGSLDFSHRADCLAAERRLRALRDLGVSMAGSKSWEQVCVDAAGAMAANGRDVLFCLIYEIDNLAGRAHLMAASGAQGGTNLAPIAIDFGRPDQSWPLANVRLGHVELVQLLPGESGSQREGAFPGRAESALLLPIASSGEGRPAAVIIAGVHPDRVVDDDYRDFMTLAASQITGALAMARSSIAGSRIRAGRTVPLDGAEEAVCRPSERKHEVPLPVVARPDDLQPHLRLESLRREAELALQESEQRFMRFMRHLPGLAWIKDLEGRYVYANEAAENAFRTSRENLYGKTDDEVFPPGVAAQFRDNDRRALASESGIQTVETLEHDDGIQHHSIVSKFAIHGWDNQPALVGGIAVDITELVRARELIDESEQRFRRLAEAIPQLVYVATSDGNIEYLNERWSEFTGRPNVDQASLRELIHPDDYALTSELWRDATVSGSPFEAAIRIKRASDGQFRWFLSRAVPITGGEGGVERWFGTCTDIDDQKRAEQVQRVLAEAGRLLAATVDYQSTMTNVCNLVIPILADWCSIDLSNHDGEVRRSAVAHVDPAKVELVREYLRLYPGHSDEKVGLTRIVQTKESQFYADVTDEHLMRSARDQEELRRLRELEVRSVLIVPLSARGRTLGELTLVMTESWRHYGEADLRLALELGSRAALALDNARLCEEAREAGRRREEALKILRASDRRKDEFLAMLAHELRNPLAAIDNAVALLDDSELGHGHAGWSVQVINRHVKNLARLIDDLLDVSRITRGKIELRTKTIDACEVLNNAIESVRPLIEERKHRLSVSFGMDLIMKADSTRLEQIAVNLLSNAAKYTESGGQIWFAARREHTEIVISVRDTGIGIPREQLATVFELFVQGDRSLERSSGGLGIGLTLVQSLAELHAGTVSASSDGPGKGSEFIVRLPAATACVLEQSEPWKHPERKASHSVRVLVVDDNEDLARGLARLLEIRGHHVRTAHDGPSGVAVATEWRPEFVLLDIGLPGMDGFQVASLLKQDEATKSAVIIGISGYGQDEDRDRSRHAFFDHYMVKPIDSSELMNILDNRS